MGLRSLLAASSYYWSWLRKTRLGASEKMGLFVSGPLFFRAVILTNAIVLFSNSRFLAKTIMHAAIQCLKLFHLLKNKVSQVRPKLCRFDAQMTLFHHFFK